MVTHKSASAKEKQPQTNLILLTVAGLTIKDASTVCQLLNLHHLLVTVQQFQ